jgi:hypothetical protein
MVFNGGMMPPGSGCPEGRLIEIAGAAVERAQGFALAALAFSASEA